MANDIQKDRKSNKNGKIIKIQKKTTRQIEIRSLLWEIHHTVYMYMLNEVQLSMLYLYCLDLKNYPEVDRYESKVEITILNFQKKKTENNNLMEDECSSTKIQMHLFRILFNP